MSAYYFDGVNDYISLGAPFFQGGNTVQEFSYATLFKVDNLPSAGQGYRISGKEGYWRTISLSVGSDRTGFFWLVRSPTPIVISGSHRPILP